MLRSLHMECNEKSVCQAVNLRSHFHDVYCRLRVPMCECLRPLRMCRTREQHQGHEHPDDEQQRRPCHPYMFHETPLPRLISYTERTKKNEVKTVLSRRRIRSHPGGSPSGSCQHLGVATNQLVRGVFGAMK